FLMPRPAKTMPQRRRGVNNTSDAAMGAAEPARDETDATRPAKNPTACTVVPTGDDATATAASAVRWAATVTAFWMPAAEKDARSGEAWGAAETGIPVCDPDSLETGAPAAGAAETAMAGRLRAGDGAACATCW